ncbi:hypothetical protein [Pseudolabrys sp.]|uniref:hypothetical protein n=1 Tax=Pseudolabrys sp. TaxID=1960880 RepID=UPI003D103B7C
MLELFRAHSRERRDAQYYELGGIVRMRISWAWLSGLVTGFAFIGLSLGGVNSTSICMFAVAGVFGWMATNNKIYPRE